MKDDRPTRSHTRLYIAIVIIATLTIAILVYVHPPGSGTTTSFPSGGTETFPTTSTTTADTISLAGFSIATSGVVQPTPYLSGQIYVDAAPGVTWSGYTLYTNGIDCGTRAFSTSTTLNYFSYFYQGMPCGPITPGDTYSIAFAVTFTDGTNATASISVLAD